MAGKRPEGRVVAWEVMAPLQRARLRADNALAGMREAEAKGDTQRFGLYAAAYVNARRDERAALGLSTPAGVA